MIPLYEISKVVKFIETESRMVVVRDCGGGGKEELFNGCRVSDLLDEKFLEICFTTIVSILNTTELYI